jgi:hypothetical protein
LNSYNCLGHPLPVRQGRSRGFEEIEMNDIEQISAEKRLQSRRQALVKLGLAATVAYATPIVASVKVYAGTTVSPSKHGANTTPGVNPGGQGGSSSSGGKGKG